MGFLVNSFLPFAGDPFFANVEALLHMDGADASTTFTDVTGRTWTASGNAQIDTAQSKFGGASGLFDGSGDYIQTAYDADLHMGSSDFTVEFWLRPNSVAAGQLIIDWRGAGDATDAMYIAQTGANPDEISFIYASDASTNTTAMESAVGLSTGTWYHVAVVRSGSTMYLFIGGSEADTFNISTYSFLNSSTPLTIGATAAGAAGLNGWLDDVRITKGVARYTSAFTPPTQAHPNS